MDQIAERLQKAEQFNQFARRRGPKELSLRRHKMTAALLSVLFSHHRSICVLITNQETESSAFTLQRPMVETCFRGCFILLCATEDRLDAIEDDTPHAYPKFADMVGQLETAYAADGHFSHATKANWDVWCSLTHSGALQILNQFSEDDRVLSSYSEEMKNKLLYHATYLLSLLTTKFYAAVGCESDAIEVDQEFSSMFLNP